MAGEQEDHEARIREALRSLAGEGRSGDAPPPDVWDRIAAAVDDAEQEPERLAHPPPELWDRIAAEVGPTTAAPDAADTASPSDPPHLTVLPVAPPRRRTRLVAAAAAALCVVGLAAALILTVGSDGGPTSEEVAQASLSGEGIDPGSATTGSAQLVRRGDDWEVAIDAAGLPSPAEGTYYEAWLLGDESGRVQSLGAIEGTGTFRVPNDLEIAAFPLVDISIEPIDGNPEHSSESVLRGQLD